MANRSRSRQLFFLGLVTSWTVGCGSSSGDFAFQAPNPQPAGAVAGRVLASNTGNPIPGATVTVAPTVAPRSEVLGRTSGDATSDANGDYRIEELDPGTYDVQATLAGRQLFKIQVTVQDGQTTTTNIDMWPNPGGVIPFQSFASDLVANDTNNRFDVFLRDRVSNTTTRVSNEVGTAGYSQFPVLSDSERHLVFSSSGQLLAEDTDNNFDVYNFDRVTNTVTRITSGLGGVDTSTCDSGELNPFTAGTGNYVAFEWPSTVYGEKVIYLFNRSNGQLLPISVPQTGNPDECSKRPVISQDEKKLFFDSAASNLVANDTNSCRDIMLYDMATSNLSIVSKAADGVSATNDCSRWPSCSADGRYVVFESRATNLVNSPAVTNNDWQIYRRDLTTGQNELVSVTSAGAAPPLHQESLRPTISADGRYVAFSSRAALLAEDTNTEEDVYLRDMTTGVTTLLSKSADDVSRVPIVASDGSFVFYHTWASILGHGVLANSQIAFHALTAGTNVLLSATPSGNPGNGNSFTRQD